jgi:hypothetical protein
MVFWCVPVILAIARLRKEDCLSQEFRVHLGNIQRHHLKKKKAQISEMSTLKTWEPLSTVCSKNKRLENKHIFLTILTRGEEMGQELPTATAWLWVLKGSESLRNIDAKELWGQGELFQIK